MTLYRLENQAPEQEESSGIDWHGNTVFLGFSAC